MTCIVGIKTAEGVYIGGDSATTNDVGLQTIIERGKVFFIGDGSNALLIGCTTSTRMMQLLHYELQVPPFEPGMDVEEYLVSKFVNAVRTCFKDGGFAQKEDERESGGNFLLGFRGRLFEIQSDYQVSEPVNGYKAVGSGNEIALGSLYTSPHLPARQRIETALQASAFHNAYVRPPFLIHCLDTERTSTEVYE